MANVSDEFEEFLRNGAYKLPKRRKFDVHDLGEFMKEAYRIVRQLIIGAIDYRGAD